MGEVVLKKIGGLPANTLCACLQLVCRGTGLLLIAFLSGLNSYSWKLENFHFICASFDPFSKTVAVESWSMGSKLQTRLGLHVYLASVKLAVAPLRATVGPL